MYSTGFRLVSWLPILNKLELSWRCFPNPIRNLKPQSESRVDRSVLLGDHGVCDCTAQWRSTECCPASRHDHRHSVRNALPLTDGLRTPGTIIHAIVSLSDSLNFTLYSVILSNSDARKREKIIACTSKQPGFNVNPTLHCDQSLCSHATSFIASRPVSVFVQKQWIPRGMC